MIRRLVFVLSVVLASVAHAATWEQVPRDRNQPPYLQGASAVYDPLNKRMLVFGGNNNDYHNDLWEFRLAGTPRWTHIAIDGLLPAPRGWSSLVVDSRRNRLVLFGGRTVGDRTLDEVWTWPLDGSSGWIRIDPQGTRPAARFGHTAIYDEKRDRLVVYGGCDDAVGFGPSLGDVWALDLGEAPEWSEIQPEGQLPDGRQEHTAVYDAVRDRMVVFGGYEQTVQVFDEVWTLDFDRPKWTLAPVASPGPVARSGHAAVVADDGMLVFGGENSGGDTWRLSLPTLTWEVVDAAGPGARRSLTAVYDPIHRQMIIQGGTENGVGFSNECWSLDLHPRTRWARLSPPDPPEFPGSADGATAVYDEDGGILLFMNFGETWRLSTGARPRWENRSAGPFPDLCIQIWHHATWDPASARARFSDGFSEWSYGDENGFETHPILWEDFPYGPRNTRNEAIIVDPDGRSVYLFGGNHPTPIESTIPSNGLYVRSLDQESAWSEVISAGEPPPAMSTAGGVYDPMRRRLVVAGAVGCNSRGCSGPTEIWAFAIGTRTWERLASIPRGQPAPGFTMVLDAAGDRIVDFWAGDSVVVTYSLATGSVATIPTSGPTPRRRFRAAVAFDDDGRQLVIYGGRLRTGEVVDELWRIPLDDLRDARPIRPRRPVSGTLALAHAAGTKVTLVVPVAEPVRLDVYDVAGRLHWSETATPSTAGTVLRELPAGLSRGLYFVRATQGASSSVTKWVKTGD